MVEEAEKGGGREEPQGEVLVSKEDEDRQTESNQWGKMKDRQTDRWQGQEGALGCLHSAVFTS